MASFFMSSPRSFVELDSGPNQLGLTWEAPYSAAFTRAQRNNSGRCYTWKYRRRALPENILLQSPVHNLTDGISNHDLELDAQTPTATFITHGNVPAPSPGKHVVAIIIASTRAEQTFAIKVEPAAAEARKAQLLTADITGHADPHLAGHGFPCFLQQFSQGHFTFNGANLDPAVIDIGGQVVDGAFLSQIHLVFPSSWQAGDLFR
jgi:hypothetical protein